MEGSRSTVPVGGCCIARRRGKGSRPRYDMNPILSVGSGRGEIVYSWTVWHFQLLVDGEAFWVHSAELEGEDARDIALTLGVPDQRAIGLDVLHSQSVVNIPWLRVRGLPLSFNQEGHVCFQAQVPCSPQAPSHVVEPLKVHGKSVEDGIPLPPAPGKGVGVVSPPRRPPPAPVAALKEELRHLRLAHALRVCDKHGLLREYLTQSDVRKVAHACRYSYARAIRVEERSPAHPLDQGSGGPPRAIPGLEDPAGETLEGTGHLSCCWCVPGVRHALPIPGEELRRCFNAYRLSPRTGNPRAPQKTNRRTPSERTRLPRARPWGIHTRRTSWPSQTTRLA